MAKNMGVEPVAIGIGLNSGPAIVGEMGSSSRSDYTAIGDAINLGARIESLCKYYGSTCQISHFTKERLEKAYSLRLLDKVRVKGKKEAVEIWQVHDFKAGVAGEYLFTCTPQALEEELALFHEAVALYHKSAFACAKVLFETHGASSMNPVVYALYAQRCEHLLAHPPEGVFDGIFEHKTKG
jgi:adenylate cyclase